METESGYTIDIVSAPEGEIHHECDDARSARPWVGVQFECCGIYARIYREPEVPSYEGRCPRCGRPISIRVGPEGLRTRFLRARPVRML